MAAVYDLMPEPPDPAEPLDPQSLTLLRRLGKMLEDRRPELERHQAYYEGQHRLAFATSKFREAFGSLFSAFSDNLCELVVDAVEERLNVEGFRMGPKGTEADRDAWRIWQANQLDAWSQIAHTTALVKGVVYVLVGPGEKRDMPEITIEDPCHTIVLYEPGSQRRRIAGLKRWVDDSGRLMANLYLPEWVEKYESDSISKTGSWDLARVRWRRRLVDGEPWPLRNALGVVPLVPLVNKPQLATEGRSEITSIIPLNDAINKLVADMLIASEFGSFRQRWATGIEVPVDEETGAEIEPFKAAVDRLWVARGSGDINNPPRFGEFEQTDLTQFTHAVELLVQHVASESRTPYHYFMQHGGQPPSGESLKSSETGLVAKAMRKQRLFGEGWEEVLSLAFRQVGQDDKAGIEDSETIWRDPESRTEAEHVDALVKMASLGVPHEILWERWGASPTEIARWKELIAAGESTEPPANERVTVTEAGPPPPDPAAEADKRHQATIASIAQLIAAQGANSARVRRVLRDPQGHIAALVDEQTTQ
jgi:hypothetical protein